MILLRRLASLRVTAALLAVFCAGTLVCHLLGWRFAPWVATCLLALAANLLAAIATNPRLRSPSPLLVFHLALLAVVLLVALGRMVYFKGQAEVLEGVPFTGELVAAEAGPWHRLRLDQARFVNHGFSVVYAPGLHRMQTRNRVSWADAEGRAQEAVIGDDTPLVLHGYRFYTTSNKGFSLVFGWEPTGGEPLLGSVNLPSYPVNALSQAQEWHLPGLQGSVWVMLQFEGDLIPTDEEGQFRLPDDYRVVVRYGDQRWEMAPGGRDAVDLPGGRLRYLEMRSWMGYLVTADATIPWLLAVSTLAVLALGWHFWRQFAARPWNPGMNAESPP